MIYDCFLFNSELDLLLLRLEFLDSVVDKFVIVESQRTLSGNNKPLYYHTHREKFSSFESKIIHLIAPDEMQMDAWEYEYFQRNYIKQALTECNDDDVILISDVDEIVNLHEIIKLENLRLPALIELPVYYYFFNLKSTQSFAVNLLCNYSFIKDKQIGERNNTYPTYVKNVIKSNKAITGWHFSYLFGFNIESYQNKIRSFSHQEYNTDFFLQKKRILQCVQLGTDLFERNYLHYFFKKTKNTYSLLSSAIHKLEMERLIYTPTFTTYLQNGNILFYLKRKIVPIIIEYSYRKPKFVLVKLIRSFTR